MMHKRDAVLQRYWTGITLSTAQEAAINAATAGQDTLVLLPTGAGKSLCYQVTALLRTGLCLVITPLTALMQDQVQDLRRRNLSADYINSFLPYTEQEHILSRAVDQHIKYLYVTPERLLSARFLASLPPLGLIVVDEAHCVSLWGHELRPAYRKVAEIKALPRAANVPWMALTATATPAVEEDIVQTLALHTPCRVHRSVSRENLTYTVHHTRATPSAVRSLISNRRALVYVPSRKKSTYWAEQLAALPYHAGLTATERHANVRQWEQEGSCLVATNAFGMGVHVDRIDIVLHIGLPLRVENYYQEVGRAGRDGAPAQTILYYDQRDITFAEEQIQDRYPPIPTIQRVYQALTNYYQIAIGSGNMQTYPFDKLHFANTYRLDLSTLHYVLLRLEQAGFLQFNAYYYRAACLRVRVDVRTLYHSSIGNVATQALFEALIRGKGGPLMEQLQPIYLPTLARRTGLSVSQIDKILLQWHAAKKVSYIPVAKHPSVTFLQARQAACFFPDIEQSKARDTAGLTQVIQYLQTSTCRNQWLLNFFGEKVGPCGRCDKCQPN